jgi:hypothetical protein
MYTLAGCIVLVCTYLHILYISLDNGDKMAQKAGFFKDMYGVRK